MSFWETGGVNSESALSDFDQNDRTRGSRSKTTRSRMASQNRYPLCYVLEQARVALRTLAVRCDAVITMERDTAFVLSPPTTETPSRKSSSQVLQVLWMYLARHAGNRSTAPPAHMSIHCVMRMRCQSTGSQ
jgi:hypothetical protein